MPKVLSISISWGFAHPNFAPVDHCLNQLGGDWIRFSPSQWFFWTELPQLDVRDAVSKAIGGDHHLLIAVLEPTACYGNTQQWIWDWLNAKMKMQLDNKFLRNTQ